MAQHIVSLKDVRVFAYHGCLPQERVLGNNFRVNLSVWTDFSGILATDSAKNGVDYSVLKDIIMQEMKISSNMLECVAQRIVSRIKSCYSELICKIEIEICKERPPFEQEVRYSCVKIIE